MAHTAHGYDCYDMKNKNKNAPERWLDGFKTEQRGSHDFLVWPSPPATRPPRAPRPNPSPLAPQHRLPCPTSCSRQKTGGRLETRPPHDPFSNDLLPFWIFR